MYQSDSIAYLEGSTSAVMFTKTSDVYAATTGTDKYYGTKTLMKEIVNSLGIAPWGEDNRFPQNIAAQLDYCGVPKPLLRFKAQAVWGGGLVWGKVTEIKDDGTEVFKIAQPGDYPDVDKFMSANRDMTRFYAEFTNDFVYYENCFPESVLSNDGKTIARWVHQESCDSRYKQMNPKNGQIEYVYLSKLWGYTRDQFPRFSRDSRAGMTTSGNSEPLRLGDYVTPVPAIDPYNSVESLRDIASGRFRNAILPVNYPSPNKPYYQLPSWDGARMAGWFEIAAKIPNMLKALYEKAFRIKYHIEIPEAYFEKKLGAEKWKSMTKDQRKAEKDDLLRAMDRFLSGDDNAWKTFVSYFDSDQRTGNEWNHIKIHVIEDKSSLDKELLTSSAANSEMCFAFQVDPTLFGAGVPGGAYKSGAGSGSDKREAWLIYLALQHMPRQLLLEPLYLTRDFNRWDPELRFRFRDTVLTTLNTGAGTDRKLS